MSEHSAEIKAILEDDAPLLALLTGGIYTKREIGEVGIDPNNTPDAYTIVNGRSVLKPCLVVKVRTTVPTYRRRDAESQQVGTNETVQLDFYDDAGFTTIDSARARVYTLLHDKTFANLGASRLINQREYHAPELDNAPALRDEYLVKFRLGA